MFLYYCQKCKSEKLQSVKRIVAETKLLDSSYKKKKYDKHTNRSNDYEKVSVLSSESTSAYRNQIEEAINNDDAFFEMRCGKLTLIAQSNEVQGTLYCEGQEPELTNILIVPCSTQPNNIHAFTGLSRDYEDTICAICGKELIWKG